jgi:Ser/Thr protein kinase RdoA (MazF antagonist)
VNEEKQALIQWKAAANLSLEKYDIKVRKITFIQISDHVTYRIDTDSNERYLLRVHINELNNNEIMSELLYLDFLTSNGFDTPRGIKNKTGKYITEVEVGGTLVNCTLMKWVEGRFIHKELKPNHVHCAGELMAKLHNKSMDFKPNEEFARPIWGEKSLREAGDKLGNYYLAFMSQNEYELMQKAVDKICNCINLLDETVDTFGVIHADLHWGNIIYHKGQPRAIDFGRSGFGFHLYDIAQSLVGLVPKDRRVFIDGYMVQRELPRGYQYIIECFFIMACIENISFHSNNPKELEDLKRQRPYVMRLVGNYLEDKSFLF